jgi:23S rRNA (uracil1939-C5)-methyltransferase
MSPEQHALETRVIDLTHEGRGVADVDGKRVFVSGALPGERIRVVPRGRRRRYEDAELLEVLEPSPDRVEASCEYFGRCGGCALQHLAWPAQVRFKQQVVEQTLARVGRVVPRRWLPAIFAQEWRYRRRARLSVRYVPRKGRVLVGFRERAASLVTDMARCPVLAPPMDGLIGDLAETLVLTGIRNRIPQIEVAVGDRASALVLRVLAPPSSADRELLADFGRRHDVDVYLQPGGPGTVVPLVPEHARPLSYALPDHGLELEFMPTDFVQINAAVNAELVNRVVELAQPGPDDRVLDLYCGLGNLSLPLAQRSRELLGVEGEGGLVARAARHAERNGLTNAKFVTADLTQSDWSFLREPRDLVILDPPRIGAEAPVAEMGRIAPRRIVYVSCHPGTLARDAQVLVERHGYELDAVGVLDMFPHTSHVEAIASFVRR